MEPLLINEDSKVDDTRVDALNRIGIHPEQHAVFDHLEMEALERLADFAEEKISWKHLRIPGPMRLDQSKLVDAVKAGFNPLCYLYQIAQGVPHSVLVKIDVRNTSGDVI